MDIKVIPQVVIRPGPGMTHAQLRIWRAQRPGRYKWGRAESRPGWTQAQAAEWIGVPLGTYQNYEQGRRPMPLLFIKRLTDYPSSLSEVVDRMWMTSVGDVDENQGVHPELKHEPKPNFERKPTYSDKGGV